MFQLYQDSIAIACYYSKIDFFLTMTRVVHGPAQARKPGQAKPYLSQAEPGQTIWPGGAFGPAQGFLKPKPSRKAPAQRDSTLADKGGNRLEDVKENMYCLL